MCDQGKVCLPETKFFYDLAMRRSAEIKGVKPAMCDLTEPKIASIYVHQEGNALDVTLDTSVAYYGDWIKGEGGDISLYRNQETDKVAGAHLPLYAQKLVIDGDHIPRITIDLTTGKVEVENAECQ